MVDSYLHTVDQGHMATALEFATAAADADEVPVGALLVDADGSVIAGAGNYQLTSHDPTAHAEIAVLRAAGQLLSNYRLPGTTLYVTLEPCTMCCGALIHARIARLVFGAREPKAGAVVSTSQALDNPALNHKVTWREGIMADESAQLLRTFFARRRR